MRSFTPQLWLVLTILLLFTQLSDALPSRSNAIAKKAPKGRNIKRAFLLPRTDEAFLGDEWSIVTMENHAAYLPQERAAHDLEIFYSSLATIALHPVFGPGSYVVHRINRVLITFHCQGIIIPHLEVREWHVGLHEDGLHLRVHDAVSARDAGLCAYGDVIGG